MRDAVLDEFEDSIDPVAALEAKSLAHHIDQYEFLIVLVIWYDVLYQVNMLVNLCNRRRQTC